MAQTPTSRDYAVTSPQMKSPEVEWVRNRLNNKGGNSNVFGVKTFTGAMDGHNYGTELADAAWEMKFRIGYPEADLSGAYGQTLDKYLIGKKPLPSGYADRMKKRKGVTAPDSPWDEKPPSNMRAEAVKRAVSKIGVKENPPDSNRCFATDWYGMVGPWCAMFVTWCYDPLGCVATAKGQRWAYVPYIVSDAKAGRNNLKVVTGDPIKGDWVCFDWNNDGEHDHVGIVEKDAKRGGPIPTIEGNTSGSGSQSNGGQVMRKTRYVRAGEIKTIVRVLK